MTKKFTKLHPSDVQEFGGKYTRRAVIKKFKTDDGLEHEFTTIYKEGSKSAAVIALTEKNEVVTVYQFRPGSEEWVYEIPGGGLEDDEDPEAGVTRELREETGYIPGEIEFLGTDHGDAYTNTTWYYYLATNCALSKEGQELDKEEDEQGTEMRLITIDELIQNAKFTSMTDPKAVLLAYEKLKELGGLNETDN